MSFLSSLSGYQQLLLGAGVGALGFALFKKHQSTCCGSSSKKEDDLLSGPIVDFGKKSKQEIETLFKNVFTELKAFVLADIKNNYEVPQENIDYVERVGFIIVIIIFEIFIFENLYIFRYYSIVVIIT